MADFKCIKVEVEGSKLTMTFLGNSNVEREDFLEESTHYLFLNWFDHRMHIVFILIREAIKNIFDHGTGKGVLVLIKDGGSYEFEFIDHNPQKINFDEISLIREGTGWVKKSSSNCNVGLSLIKRFGKEEGVILRVDDTKGGINYSGSYSAQKE